MRKPQSTRRGDCVIRTKRNKFHLDGKLKQRSWSGKVRLYSGNASSPRDVSWASSGPRTRDGHSIHSRGLGPTWSRILVSKWMFPFLAHTSLLESRFYPPDIQKFRESNKAEFKAAGIWGRGPLENAAPKPSEPFHPAEVSPQSGWASAAGFFAFVFIITVCLSSLLSQH